MKNKGLSFEAISSEIKNLNTLGGTFDVEYRKEGKNKVRFNYSATCSLDIAKLLGYKFVEKPVKPKGETVKKKTFESEVQDFIKEQRLFNKNQMEFNNNVQNFIMAQIKFNEGQTKFNKDQTKFNEEQTKFNKDQTKFNKNQKEWNKILERKVDRILVLPTIKKELKENSD